MTLGNMISKRSHSVRQSRSRHKFLYILAMLILVFTFILPKAGFYVGANKIPITFGYLLLPIFLIVEFVSIRKINKRILIAALLLGILGILSTISVFSFGISQLDGLQINALSFLLSLGPVSAISILVFGLLINRFGFEPMAKMFPSALVIGVLLTIITFIAYNAGHVLVGIPYITVTGDDVSAVLEKHSNRGGIIKAFGAWNNGNVLGVNLLMWGPPALALILRERWINMFRLALVSTLSRTAWLGLIAYEFLQALASRRLWAVLRLLLLIPIVISAIGIVADSVLHWDAGTIFDSNLGGRSSSLQFTIGLFPKEFQGVMEIVYAGVLNSFGLFGLVLFLVIWCWPIFVRVNHLPGKSARIGMILYIICMLSDGAFIAPPTTSIYWAMAAIVLLDPEWEISLNTKRRVRRRVNFIFRR